MGKIIEWTDVYHVFDPGADRNRIAAVCDTLDAAIAEANVVLRGNWVPDAGDEWSGDVSGIGVYRAPRDCAEPVEDGILVAQAQEVDVCERPDDVDEDGYSVSHPEHWWGSSAPDYYCDYRVLPTSEQSK